MTPLVLPHSIWGASDGLCLVMIHPLGGERRFWKAASARLGPGVMAVACDLRGSGDAPLPAEPLMLEQTVADVEALRRWLGAERLVVMGCAIGSMAAALYAARHPDRVLALVMSNPGIRIGAAASENLRARARLVREGGMGALLPAVTDGAFFGRSDGDLRRLFESRLLAQDPEGYALAALGACDADIAPALHGITCPALLVCGSNDRLLPPAHAHEIAREVKQARLVTFPEGAHFIPFQQPREFGDAVAAFLDGEGLRRA